MSDNPHAEKSETTHADLGPLPQAEHPLPDPNPPFNDPARSEEAAGTQNHETAINELFDRVTAIEHKLFAEGDAGPANAELIQGLVNFLHHHFPGHNPPGTPTDRPVTATA